MRGIGRVDGGGGHSSAGCALTVVAVAVTPTDALVAAGAERPATVLRRRPVAGQQHAGDVGAAPRMVEGAQQLVDGAGPEGVADLGPVDRDAHGAAPARVTHGPVVGHVGEIVEPRDPRPARRNERLTG